MTRVRRMDLFDGLPDPLSSGVDVPVFQDGSAKVISSGNAIHVTGETSAEPAVARKRSLQPEEAKSEVASGVDNHTAKKFRCGAQGSAMKGYVMEIQGERDDMEDFHCLVDTIDDSRISAHPDICSAAFYAVFDGHAGRRASRFASENFLNYFLSSFAARVGNADLDASITSCLTKCYKAMDEAFLSKASAQPPLKDGTTATTILIVNNKAYVANVGDSKAVLCRYDKNTNSHKAVPLTVDHSPDKYEERIRIQQQGGRVKEGRINGILEVSRSLGDLPHKKGTGLICTPSIQKCPITEDDKFMVIACDGLWKSLTPAEAIDLVVEFIKDCDEAEVDTRFNAACSKLVKEAVTRLSGDNVTVLLVRICPPPSR
ncbi:hypothetical protein RvY_08923-2 [Ramazzottius varieornatus]|uniref:PPM-type phosphatase domain-containing protein n=1 Tax=Ramazzottius varieornatus TaxID=947166 RepID=A0A1D1V7L6_RAMVA|nr:hypothetical protein RvY_08923-2 [Ramazzottius varieornatus]